MQHDPLERDPLLARRLQRLPEEPQPYGFAELQRRARQRPRRLLGRFPGFAQRWIFSSALVVTVAAAVALAAFGLHGLRGLAGPAAGSAPTALGAPQLPAQGPAAVSVGQDPVITPAQAAAMEGWLASLPAEPAVVNAGARAAVARLEDRIALLDDVISAERAARAPAARLAVIEQQRSQVLRSLVQVRYAEGLATASY